MKDFLKKAAPMAAIGLAAGLLVGLGFTLAFGLHEHFGAHRLLVYMLISGAMGMINLGTVSIYDIESWSITRCTLTHFAIVMATVCGLGLFLGWFAEASGFIMLAVSVVIYFIIWLIMYLSYRRRVRRMNEDLKHWKDAQGKE